MLARQHVPCSGPQGCCGEQDRTATGAEVKRPRRCRGPRSIFMRAWPIGQAPAFQAVDASSILAARSMRTDCLRPWQEDVATPGSLRANLGCEQHWRLPLPVKQTF